MSDIDKYVTRRKAKDKSFALNFDEGYADFKVGILIKQARESAGVTQETLAKRIKTNKTAISRLENHADNVRLSTLRNVARALGKNLKVVIG